MNDKKIPPSVAEYSIGEFEGMQSRIAELEAQLAALKQPSAWADERAAFEAAVRKHHQGDMRHLDARTESGYYVHYIQDLWLIWQARAYLDASREVPEGWVPLTIEFEPGYPEDVAFGPQRMMSRLKKWLDKHYAMLAAAPSPAQAIDVQAPATDGAVADGVPNGKAGGVVLPQPIKRGDEGGSGEYGAAMIRGYNACLREVARLNSTPVSAGEIPFAGFDPNFCPGSNPENPQEPDDDQAYDRNAERLTAEVFGVGAGINHSATSIDDLFTDAGGVDERADLEKRTHDILIRCLNHPHTFRHQIVSDDELCDVIEARAALSAPSHGEQVREVPSNCRQRLAAEGKAYPKSSCAVCGQFSPKWRECDAMLAAAPSAGSQGQA